MYAKKYHPEGYNPLLNDTFYKSVQIIQFAFISCLEAYLPYQEDIFSKLQGQKR